MPIILKIGSPLPVTAPGKGSNLVGGQMGVRPGASFGTGTSDTPGTGVGITFTSGEPSQSGGANTDLVMDNAGDPSAPNSPLRTTGVQIKLGTIGAGAGAEHHPVGIAAHWPGLIEGPAFGSDQKVINVSGISGTTDPHTGMLGDNYVWDSGFDIDAMHKIGYSVNPDGSDAIPNMRRWLYAFHPNALSKDVVTGIWSNNARWFRPFVNVYRFFKGAENTQWTVDWYDPLPESGFSEEYGVGLAALNPYAPPEQSIPTPHPTDLVSSPEDYGFLKVPVLEEGTEGKWGQVVLGSKFVYSDVAVDGTYNVPKLALPLFVFTTNEEVFVFIPHSSNVQVPVVPEEDGSSTGGRVCGYPLMTDGILVIKGVSGALTRTFAVAFLRFLGEPAPCIVDPELTLIHSQVDFESGYFGDMSTWTPPNPDMLVGWVFTLTGNCSEEITWIAECPTSPETISGYGLIDGDPNAFGVVTNTGGGAIIYVSAVVLGVTYGPIEVFYAI